MNLLSTRAQSVSTLASGATRLRAISRREISRNFPQFDRPSRTVRSYPLIAGAGYMIVRGPMILVVDNDPIGLTIAPTVSI